MSSLKTLSIVVLVLAGVLVLILMSYFAYRAYQSRTPMPDKVIVLDSGSTTTTFSKNGMSIVSEPASVTSIPTATTSQGSVGSTVSNALQSASNAITSALAPTRSGGVTNQRGYPAYYEPHYY